MRRSSGVIPSSSTARSAIHERFRWVSITAFGAPVVPEV